MSIRIQLLRGLSTQRKDRTFLEGEVHYDTDTEELRIGNSKGESVPIMKIVEGPHNKVLYAEVPDSPIFIPMCIGLREPA